MKRFMTSKLAVAALAVAMLGLAGCDECDRAAQTINDLTRAKALLQSGLANPGTWVGTCDTLVQSAEVFRSDADFVRSVADSRYSGIPAGCVERGWVEYCHGGWVRRPYYPYSMNAADELAGTLVAYAASDDAATASDADPALALELDRPGHGGGSRPHPVPAPHPGPAPRPHPVPRPYPHPVPAPYPRPRPPVVVYPPHYPSHPRWGWYYEPRVCEMVPVCLRYSPGTPTHPGYQQIMAIAYELDQAAGGIENTCQKAFVGEPAEVVNALASDTLTRIERNAAPGAQSVYNGLGCQARGGH